MDEGSHERLILCHECGKAAYVPFEPTPGRPVYCPPCYRRRAEEELREALRQERRYAKVYVELGKVLARRGRNREAIEVYEASLSVQPDDWRVHHTLGLLHVRVGEDDKAEAAFRRASALEPGQTESPAQLRELLARRGLVFDPRRE